MSCEIVGVEDSKIGTHCDGFKPDNKARQRTVAVFV